MQTPIKCSYDLWVAALAGPPLEKKTQLLKQTKNNNISLIIHLGVPE